MKPYWAITVSVLVKLPMIRTLIHVFLSQVNNRALIIFIMTLKLFALKNILNHLSSHHRLISRDKMTSSLDYHLDQISKLLHVPSHFEATICVLKFVKPAFLFMKLCNVFPSDLLHPFLDTNRTVKKIELAWVNEYNHLRNQFIYDWESVSKFVFLKSVAYCRVVCWVLFVVREM